MMIDYGRQAVTPIISPTGRHIDHACIHKPKDVDRQFFSCIFVIPLLEQYIKGDDKYFVIVAKLISVRRKPSPTNYF